VQRLLGHGAMSRDAMARARRRKSRAREIRLLPRGNDRARTALPRRSVDMTFILAIDWHSEGGPGAEIFVIIAGFSIHSS